MTEDEAKTKWCPWARVTDHLSPRGGSVNRPFNPDPHMPICKCLGSMCAVWRSSKRYGKEIERRPSSACSERPGEDWFAQDADGGRIYGDWVRFETISDGYCGLAGAQR